MSGNTLRKRSTILTKFAPTLPMTTPTRPTGYNGNLRPYSRPGGVSPSGPPPPQSHFTPSALCPGVRIRHSVCARKNAVARFGGVPRTPQPARDGRNLEGQGINFHWLEPSPPAVFLMPPRPRSAARPPGWRRSSRCGAIIQTHVCKTCNGSN